jgi:hypothetical protein
VNATSEYLNRRPRTLLQAVRDISAVRDMPIWVWDELLCPLRSNVVRLSDHRDHLRQNTVGVGAWQGPGSAA